MTLFLSHRGESDDAPENTLEAYRLAVARNSDGIELDIRLTADRQIVCVHDADLMRVAGNPAVISQMTLEQLQRIHPIPLLREVLELLTPSMRLQIELKGDDPQLPELLKRELPISGVDLRQLVLTSFETSTIKKCAPLFPELPRLLLIDWKKSFNSIPSAPEVQNFLRPLGCTGISFRASKSINGELVRQLHELGFMVVCWGVSSDRLGLAMADAGVDAMTCNHAVALREIRRKNTAAL